MSHFGPRRGDTIYELRATIAAIEKLAARGISVEEAEELPRNNHVTLRNRGSARRSARKLRDRRLLIGETNGGRTLTLVIERTNNPTSWLIITGWTATRDERRRITKD